MPRGAFQEVVLPHLDAAFNYARWLTRTPTLRTSCRTRTRGRCGSFRLSVGRRPSVAADYRAQHLVRPFFQAWRLRAACGVRRDEGQPI